MQRNLYVHYRVISPLFALIAAMLCVAPLSAQGQCGGNPELQYLNTDSNEFFESFDQFTLIGYDKAGEEFGRTERKLVGNDLLVSYQNGATYVQAACSLETAECIVSENGQVLEDGVLGSKASQMVSRIETQSAGLLRPGLPIGIGGSVGLEVECDVCWGTLTFTNAEGETYTVPVPYPCNCRVKLKIEFDF